MPSTIEKRNASFYDHLRGFLILFAIVGIVLAGGATLYLTGIFDPVAVGPALVDTKPLDLATMPPQHSRILDWLFPSASAEADVPEDASAEPSTGVQDPDAAEATEAPKFVTPDELEMLLAEIAAEEPNEIEITEADAIAVDKADLSINENLPGDLYNVLLLATDSRDVTAIGGRSDVMIIASVNKATAEVKLCSISRDLYVEIPGGSRNKLNAAYAYGGPLLAVKTINQVFEMNLHDYMVVNFHTMASIVDSLGGVSIHLDPMDWYYINYLVAVAEDYEGFAKSASRHTLNAAQHENTSVHLDGLQAVSYARIRQKDNDFQRGNRQRILLNAMMEQGLSNLSFSSFMGLATSIMNSLSTNVTLQTVIDIGKWMLDTDGAITMKDMAIPIAGSYQSAMEKNMDVITFNNAQNTQALHEFLYGEYYPAQSAKK